MNGKTFDFAKSIKDRASPDGRKLTVWVSLFIHGAVFALITVYPLMQVASELPAVDSIATFMVTPPAPPSPPPPAPPASSRSTSAGKAPRPRPPASATRATFLAPIELPNSIPELEEGGAEWGVPGGIERGVPGGIVGGLAPERTAATEPVRLDGRSEPATPTKRVPPVYPEVARQARAQGVVLLEVLVNRRGVPESIQVLRSVPLLDQAAIDAVEQWRWKPYVLKGQVIPFWVTVNVLFRLSGVSSSDR